MKVPRATSSAARNCIGPVSVQYAGGPADELVVTFYSAAGQRLGAATFSPALVAPPLLMTSLQLPIGFN